MIVKDFIVYDAIANDECQIFTPIIVTNTTTFVTNTTDLKCYCNLSHKQTQCYELDESKFYIKHLYDYITIFIIIIHVLIIFLNKKNPSSSSKQFNLI